MPDVKLLRPVCCDTFFNLSAFLYDFFMRILQTLSGISNRVLLSWRLRMMIPDSTKKVAVAENQPFSSASSISIKARKPHAQQLCLS